MNIASLLSARDDEPAEALQHYRRALALREWPADTAAHAEYNAALALQTLGGASNISAAIAALRRALRRSPQFALALEFLDELEEPAVDAASEAADGRLQRTATDDDDGDGLGTCGGSGGGGSTERAAPGHCQRPQGTRGHADGAADAEPLGASAAALHEAATSLRRVAQRALTDPSWPAAAMRIHAPADGSTLREDQLLASLIGDLSTLLRRLLDSPDHAPDEDDSTKVHAKGP